METEINYIKFRTIEVSDYDFLWLLHKAALKKYVTATWGWDENWQREYFAKEFNTKNGKIIVFEDQDAGFLWYRENPFENSLVSVKLLPEFQNKGIGTKIIKELIENSDKSITLQVLKINPARCLYERLGFIVSSENETHFKMTYYKNA